MPPKKRVRHDVVMAAKIRLGWKDIPADERPSLAHVAAEAGAAWLRNRQEALGCDIDYKDLWVDGYRQHRLFKRNRHQPINFSTLDFTGILTVDEPNIFVKECLFTGIGPAKGFGCGLMLVRRV
jgi:CRISPR system Cascade subunit CasE